MGTLADRVGAMNAALNAHDVNSRDEVGRFYAGLFRAFPDIKTKVLRIAEQGNTMTVEYETTGTLFNQLEILIQLGLQPGSSLVAVPTGSR